ncbi:MAG: hypothetical protein HFI34_00350 [Lachnospiraceae bacterium]|nr:hypothetical protein [Lachnospiraceae bacterium]
MKVTENRTNPYISRDTGNNRFSKSKKKKDGFLRVHIGFNPSGEKARIANAKTQSQVTAIERSLRSTLQMAERYNSDDNTIRAIKKTIAKAVRKHKALGKEERMENARKVAESAKNREAEYRIAQELAQKRNARERRERAEAAVTDGVSRTHNKRDNGYDRGRESNRENRIDVLCDEFTGTSQADISVPAEVAGAEVDITL